MNKRAFIKLASGPMVIAASLSLAVIVHTYIGFLWPYYVGQTEWATSFWQEHLRLWEFRGLSFCAAIFLLGVWLVSLKYKAHEIT